MKTLRTPTENLELVFTYMAKACAALEEKTEVTCPHKGYHTLS